MAISQMSGIAMRGLGGGLNTVRNRTSGFKHSMDELRAGTRASLTNYFRTSNAITEGSRDISKLVDGLPYKARLMPASVGYESSLSLNGKSLFLSEKLFSTPEFKHIVAEETKEQGLDIDPEKLQIRMDYFGRITFAYPGHFQNKSLFLDQFGEGTPTHTALSNTLKHFITVENQKICGQMILGHILKDTILKNNYFIKGSLDGQMKSIDLAKAVDVVLKGEPEGDKTIINSLLEEQGSSLSDVRDLLNDENIAPQDIIRQFPNGRKVMDKALVGRNNRRYTLEGVHNSLPKSGSQPSQSTEQSQETPIKLVENSTESSNIHILNPLRRLYEPEKIESIQAAKYAVTHIKNFIAGAPNLVSTNFELYNDIIDLQTAIQTNIDDGKYPDTFQKIA